MHGFQITDYMETDRIQRYARTLRRVLSAHLGSMFSAAQTTANCCFKLSGSPVGDNDVSVDGPLFAAASRYALAWRSMSLGLSWGVPACCSCPLARGRAEPADTYAKCGYATHTQWQTQSTAHIYISAMSADCWKNHARLKCTYTILCMG